MKILLTLIILLISGNSAEKSIPNITNPQQIIWQNLSTIVIVKDSHIFEYNWIFETQQEIGLRSPDEFIWLDGQGIINKCKIEHRLINSSEEFSTIFYISEKKLSFVPTIRPISISGDTIIAVTALDFLEQHYYKISIEKETIEEIDSPSQNQDRSLFVREDLFGNLYVNYNFRDLFTRTLKLQLDSIWQHVQQDIFQKQVQ